MRRPALILLLSCTAFAAEKPTIKYKAPPGDADDRPVATSITVAVQGSDFAVRVEFNKTPWGEDCKSRCANTTLFIDTDDNAGTGLQLGKGVPETGADLAVVIQGVRDYKEGSALVLLRVKALQLADGTKSIDNGDSLAELDNRRDSERLQSDGNTVYALIDGTTATLPSGKTMRVVYHPPESKALVGKAKGMMAPSAGKIEIFRKGKAESGGKKKKSAETY